MALQIKDPRKGIHLMDLWKLIFQDSSIIHMVSGEEEVSKIMVLVQEFIRIQAVVSLKPIIQFIEGEVARLQSKLQQHQLQLDLQDSYLHKRR